MRIRFLEIAEIELDEAVRYYNYEAPDLGNDFLKEVLKSLDMIHRFPQSWHPCSKRTRQTSGLKMPSFSLLSVRHSLTLLKAKFNQEGN